MNGTDPPIPSELFYKYKLHCDFAAFLSMRITFTYLHVNAGVYFNKRLSTPGKRVLSLSLTSGAEHITRVSGRL